MGEVMETWVGRHLGDHEVVQSREWHNRRVLEVRAADGSRWFAKRAGSSGEWARERRAYRWASSLGDRVPRLLAAHRARRLFLLTALPGEAPAPGDRAAARAAGRLLGALHATRPERPPAQVGEWAAGRVDGLVARTPGALTREETTFARNQARVLAALPPRPRVPCHGDFVPRNWLVDSVGTLRTIDFGLARWQVPAFDLTKLYVGPWWPRPGMGEAFLRGYGRSLEPDEMTFIEGHLTMIAVGRLCEGYRTGSPDRARRGRTRLRRLMEGYTPLTRDGEPVREVS